MYTRFCLYASISAALSLILLIGLYQSPWPSIHRPHLADYLFNVQQHNDDQNEADAQNIQNATSDQPLNITTYPQTTLVLATLAADDNTWLDREMSDMLGPATNLYTALYVVDSPTAPLHTPANKGHEAMAYLTYIIDFYAVLPSISIFLHGHPSAWHNNYLLDMSTSQMTRRLSRETVLRDGYVNLRCHWSPGCPSHLHPQETEFDSTKTEELHIQAAWTQLFPSDPLPSDLAQPCCSQFAVSRDTILRHPREKYIRFRDWLLETPLSDYITGRIFEYFWQYIFLSEAEVCPDPRVCYCDTYGVCFEDPDEYGHFFDLVVEMDVLRRELEAWGRFALGKLGGRDVDENGEEEEDMEDLVFASTLTTRSDKERDEGPDPVVEGGESRQAWLEQKIHSIEEELSRRKEAAFEAGRDPSRRATAIEAARNQTIIDNPKDGPPFWTQR